MLDLDHAALREGAEPGRHAPARHAGPLDDLAVAQLPILLGQARADRVLYRLHRARYARTMRRIEASAKAMVEALPDLVKINLTKKSGMPEVRLRDSRPVEEREFGEAVLRKYKMPKASSS